MLDYTIGADIRDTGARRPDRGRWDTRTFQARLVNPANRRKRTGSSSSAPAWPAARPRPRWPSRATRVAVSSASRIARGARTPSPRRAASTPPRTTATTATASTASSTTRSRAATSASREANVYRLAQVSVNIIDQCVAQGVPFAREYGGLLDNRSFGGAQVSRTFYARGQTGQQLLLGAYQALARQIARGHGRRCTRAPRCSTSSWSTARPAASSRATWSPAQIATHLADAVVLATGGYGNVFYLSTNAKGCNATAIWRAHQRGALLRQPLLHADPPDLHPASAASTSRS